MKHLLFWIGVLIIIASCSTQKGVGKVKANVEANTVTDSVEYDIETFDSKFESWYVMNNSPARYHSKSYYESWNDRYVTAWNINSMNPHKNSFFEPIIGYNPTVDYGFDLNHELFYYFQYVEHVLKIQIMPGGPKAFPF
ncbi:MAG: hypothetical protein HN778_11375 [Prolixibacteraceae bacterium]|jgi:hypothetical protein|nr:hypothetical protein [Prolixibacteraceae bacterium]MBT6006633.1 hypothetical protein [Prolixibacteraceae bacterium]MBT6766608.1 hypothetical protein [Prolixibacteraceae bacterium]MBT7000330.1 hypothetical protein [Prolixibacteraceae bacterium]MBT7395424.1 hypothetical protein [Prolixibacteraceae bacterium]